MTVQVDGTPRQDVVPALRSPVVTGAVGAVWAGLVGLAACVLAVLVVWLLAAHGSSGPGDALHAGLLVWLAANHGTLVISGAALDLAPLALMAVPALALFRAGRWAGRTSAEALPAALAAAVSMALTYGIGAGVIASASAQRGSAADVGGCLVGGAVLAFVAGGLGVLHGAGLWEAVWDRLPEPAVPVLRGAGVGLAVLVGGGALLLALSLLTHLHQVAALTADLHAGPAGGLALMLLGVLYVPTAVVWASAYAVGPGFSVGLGTAVAPAGITLGAVPAFPLLGTLPDTGHAPGASLVALGTAPLAGMAVGWLAARRPAPTPARTATEALLSGVLAGVGLGLLALLSTGSLGAVRMSELGPDALRVAVCAGAVVGTVAAAVAYEACRHRVRLDAAGRWLHARSAAVRGAARRLPLVGRSGGGAADR